MPAKHAAARRSAPARACSTNLGGNVSADNAATIFEDRTNPQVWRFTLGVQRELPGNFLVELTYLGQRGQNIPYVQQLNFVPEQFRTQDPRNNAAARHVPHRRSCPTRSAA